MADILTVLWALGGFLSAGIYRGLTLGNKEDEWNFWSSLSMFAFSWFAIGMFLSAIILETTEIKNLLKEKGK